VVLSSQTEPVAEAIRDHQTRTAAEWRHHRLVRELHCWAKRFDTDVGVGLPTPVIAVGSLRVDVLATYHQGRNEIGARIAITFNERWLPYRSFSDALVTLAHELVHVYEEWHRGRPSSLRTWAATA
jgi:hypothetical protein